VWVHSVSPEAGTQLDKILLGKRSAKSNVRSQEKRKVTNRREAGKKKGVIWKADERDRWDTRE
jgi:hypothetical protein